MTNKRKAGKHYPRRFLTLKYRFSEGTATPEIVEIRCTEETVQNYFGHVASHRTPGKEIRFPKSLWEVQVDKTK